ncbi:hypothetical protein DRO69_09995 [Candidatus Bathyarchaeota archaeon]|nr:MAG: hypothetical protein DRO69_09995 [Candidatus Bathyarchaeota archaeon]
MIQKKATSPFVLVMILIMFFSALPISKASPIDYDSQKRYLRLYTKNFDDVAYLEKWQTISDLDFRKWKTLSIKFKITQFNATQQSSDIQFSIAEFPYYGIGYAKTGGSLTLYMRYPQYTGNPPILISGIASLGTINLNTWYNFTQLHKTVNDLDEPIGEVEAYLNGVLKASVTDAYPGNPPNMDWTRFGYDSQGNPWVKTELFVDWYIFKDGNSIKLEYDFEKTLVGFIPKTLGDGIVELYPDYRQKYPFVYDPNFQIASFDLIDEPEEGGEAPPPGTSKPSGVWYPGLWGHRSPESYAYITSRRAYLCTLSISWDPTEWGGATVNQGRPPHLSAQIGRFKGSNDTSSNAVETSRIIFPMNETLEEGSLWLFVRAKIVDRAVKNYENIAAQANLGLNFIFQYEYKTTNDGKYHLSDYDAGKWDYPRGNPQVIHFDVFLSQHHWSLGIDLGEQIIGWEQKHSNAAADVDLHVQRVVGQMGSKGIWYYFTLDLAYLLERAKIMSNDHLEFLWDDSYIPDAPYRDLTALILRNIQTYTEATGGYIDALVDYVLIEGSKDITARISFTAESDDNRYISPYLVLDNDFYAVAPTTLYIMPGTYQLSVPVYHYERIGGLPGHGSGIARMYQLERLEVDGNKFYPDKNKNELTEKVVLTPSSSIKVYYEFLRTVRCVLARQGNLTLSTPIYNDDYVYARMRTTLGNNVSYYSVVCTTATKTIDVNTMGIEEIHIDLGKFWGDFENVPGFGSLFSPAVPPDATLHVHADNVTYIDVRLENVPNVLRIEKNGIPFGNDPTDEHGNPKSHWNYTDGNLIIRLYSGDMSELWIDFETPFSLAWNVLIPSITVLITCLTVAWLYRRLREL